MKTSLDAANTAVKKLSSNLDHHDFIVSIGITTDHDDHPRSGGHAIVLGVTDLDLARSLRNRGEIPRIVKQAVYEFPVVLRESDPIVLASHTSKERPMKPGTSIGSFGVSSAGTFGGLFGNTGLTAGHVLPGYDPRVTQPGQNDAPLEPPQNIVIGRVMENAYTTGEKIDAASFRTGDGIPIPHDNVPAPSPGTPGVGLLVAKSKTRAQYLPLKKAMSAVHIPEPPNSVIDPEKGMIIVKTGRTTRKTAGKIIDVGTIIKPVDGQGNRMPDQTDCFVTTQYVEPGDSGSVGITKLHRTATFDQQTSTDTSGGAADHEVTGTLALSDEYASEEPLISVLSSITNDTRIEYDNGSGKPNAGDPGGIRRKIIEIFRNLDTKSNFRISATSSKQSCAETGGRKFGTKGLVIISRTNGTQEERRHPTTPREVPEIEQPENFSGECCTFGAIPVVTVQADDDLDIPTEFKIGPVTLTGKIKVQVRVSGGEVTRSGHCWQSRCESEILSGFVTASATFTTELTANASAVKIGKLKLGTTSTTYNRTDTENVRWRFQIKC